MKKITETYISSEEMRVTKSADGRWATVSALGIRFSTPDDTDTDGDFFDANTYFGHLAGDNAEATLNHRMPIKTTSAKSNQILKEGARHNFTNPVRAERTELGIVATHVLDLSNAWERWVANLAEKGALRWSSGSSPQLVEVEQVKGAQRIARWPIVEWAYTPTPADGFLPKIAPIKSIEFEVDLPYPEDEESSERGEVDDNQSTTKSASSNEVIMKNKSTSPEGVTEENTASDAAAQAAQLERVLAELNTLKSAQADMAAMFKTVKNSPGTSAPMPAFNKTSRGDNWETAFHWYVKTGDESSISSFTKASNDTDMNIGTAADGGNAVPTGHVNDIVARRDESGLLFKKLGVQPIPGVGTTVNAPIDDEADGEFVSTAEAGTFDRDAPALGQKQFTLVKYTKRVELSVELLNDETSRLLNFLANFVGRGLAKTENNLLLVEVATNGTNLHSFASSGTIAAGEPESVVDNDDLAAYIEDDSGSVGWVMRPSTHWVIRKITGNDRLYDTGHEAGDRSLLGWPVAHSNKAAAIGSQAKSVYFGNWNFVGRYERPGMTFLRDPYSKASTGQVVLHYFFRVAYGVLQAEAIGYGTQAS